MATERPRKQVFYAPQAQRHTSPIPEGVIANGFVFLSAVRGVVPGTATVEEDDAEKQARQLFENVRLTLEGIGGTLQDIVKIAIYLKDMNDREALNKVWAEYFPQDPPARFAVQVVDMGVVGDKTKFLADVTALAPQ